MSGEKQTLTPVWIVYVDGKRLSPEYEGKLKSINVKDCIDDIGSASLFFDYSDLKFNEDETFSVDSEVSIHLGYKDDVEQVFTGVVTGFESRFKKNGNQQIEVVIKSKLHYLKHGQKSCTYSDKKPSEIIKDILTNYDFEPDVEDFGPKNVFLVQQVQSDYEFITNLTKKYGKTIYCYGNKVSIKTEITPSNDEVVLEWGKSLIDCFPTANINKQLSSVTCFCYDPANIKNYQATVKLSDLPLKIGGEYSFEDNSNGYDELKTHYILGGIDEDDAKNIAAGYLLKRSLDFQTASATTEGNYRIRPGNRLTLKYISSFFSGEYLVVEVTHTFDLFNGYKTTCQLIRNFCETTNKSKVSAVDSERAATQEQQEEEPQEETKNPQITNPCWKNADGQSITKALVGDEVLLCADVQDIDDGKTVKIKIVEKDDDGNDDDVVKLSGKVKDGKIECKWKVTYTADDDDSNSKEEMEEKGYTLPEYAFTMECDGVESGESGQLDVTNWIKTMAKFEDFNSELFNKEYIILKTDGTKIIGKTTTNGNIEENNLEFGSYFIGMKWEKNENE